jgi:hypothetical protein
MGFLALLVAAYVDSNLRNRMAALQSLPVYVVISGLFYVPAFISSNLTLDFLNAARPLDQGFAGLAYRFIYKLHLLYGIAGTYVVIVMLSWSVRQYSKDELVIDKRVRQAARSAPWLLSCLLSRFFYGYP